MRHRTSRRAFVQASVGAGISCFAAPHLVVEGASPSESLNLGIIGSGGRGRANLQGVLADPGVNIVALCDINDEILGQTAQWLESGESSAGKKSQEGGKKASSVAGGPARGKHKPKAYRDWRKLLEQKDVDAVIISTPDHHHALAAVAAMKAGKHVYCEKPLAHSVYEARRVRETYLSSKLATQMGTQIHADDNYRRVVELIQSGAIGPVREVHVWCGRTGLAQGTTRPEAVESCPKYIDWDLWLGPAQERPYHKSYFGGCMVWEQRWDFGNGCLGDMGSHLIDLPFWALGLRQPLSVEAEGAYQSDETYPQWLTARWEHPVTAARPGLKLCWYDGGKRPPNVAGHDLSQWDIGVLFVGDEGQLLADYGRRYLLPEEKFKNVRPPKETIPPSLGHYREWLHACRTGAPTLCNFDYSGMLVEHNLLAIAAFRVGKRLVWDAESMKAVGCPEADRYLRRTYRPGWTI